MRTVQLRRIVVRAFGLVMALSVRRNTLVLSGEFSGTKVAYLPTDRDLGMIIEIFSGTPGAEEEPDAS